MIYMLAGAALVLLTGWAATYWKYKKNRERIANLTEAIEDYLSGRRDNLSLSVADDSLAALENAAAELQYAHLLEKEKRERVLKEEADFIADVSHQFKTPLAAIRLFTEMDESEHAPQMMELLERMERWIYALLRLEKLRSGAYEMEFLPRELSFTVREAVREMEVLYPQTPIAVTGQAILRCDEKYLWEAVGNVIKNACQHASSKVEVVIEDRGTSVFVHVEDDGEGVPEDKLGEIFRRFSTESGREPQSHGLGLAIAREIVERHHGSISAENTQKGLRVTMCFPVIEGRVAL